MSLLSPHDPDIHDGGTSEVTLNQTVNGWDWVPLGTYTLTPGSGAKVTLDNSQPGTVCADAIAFGRDLNDKRVVADAVKFVPNTAEAALAVHADHLGSPQKMTDPAGAVVWDAAYKPFGEEAAIAGAATNNQRFPGQYFDAETGLHQNWFRDYDPALGRYVQSDPIGLRGGVNTYGYVGGNPLMLIDRKGLAIGPTPEGFFDCSLIDWEHRRGEFIKTYRKETGKTDKKYLWSYSEFELKYGCAKNVKYPLCGLTGQI